jgi:hypothetical protein
MSKGIVFFFEGEHRAWFCQQVTYTENGIRGYALDGCWWMDYNIATETVNVCISTRGEINWDKPINTFKTKLISQVVVPKEIEGSAFELLKWARKEKELR